MFCAIFPRVAESIHRRSDELRHAISRSFNRNSGDSEAESLHEALLHAKTGFTQRGKGPHRPAELSDQNPGAGLGEPLSLALALHPARSPL